MIGKVVFVSAVVMLALIFMAAVTSPPWQQRYKPLVVEPIKLPVDPPDMPYCYPSMPYCRD